MKPTYSCLLTLLTAAHPPVVVDGDEDDCVGDDDDAERDEEEEGGVQDELGLLPRGRRVRAEVHALRVPREIRVRRYVEDVQLWTRDRVVEKFSIFRI